MGTLAGKSTIADADVSASAAIATTKLSGTVTSISNHGLGTLATKSTIADADVSASAAIDGSKIDPDFGSQNIFTTGQIGIGTTALDTFKLVVDGTINSKEVAISTTIPAPDYVFEESYNLISLKELEKSINKNKHLPDIPSAKEIAQDGLKVAEMQMKLLQKIEELTLYVIEQNKRINELENQNKELSNLKKENIHLKKRMPNLEKQNN